MVKQDFQSIIISSGLLKRQVKVDIYHPTLYGELSSMNVLFINDGQDLEKMGFSKMINNQFGSERPLMAIGIHAGMERRQEYGVAGIPDYLDRGSKAFAYSRFILDELIPFVKSIFPASEIDKKYLAGFSLGGLMAFDMALEYPQEFSAVGVFSGSFWWRSKALEKGYIEEVDRIMHAKIRNKKSEAHLRFFLQTGQLDETADRNNNGIIDSIDDTMGIIEELKRIGYEPNEQITYLELPDGKHEVETWGRVMPMYLEWLDQLK